MEQLLNRSGAKPSEGRTSVASSPATPHPNAAAASGSSAVECNQADVLVSVFEHDDPESSNPPLGDDDRAVVKTERDMQGMDKKSSQLSKIFLGNRSGCNA